MYTSFNASDDLAQGDIIRNVVIAYVDSIADPPFFILNNDDEADPVDKDLSEPFGEDERLVVLSSAQKSDVIIISQSCDVLRKDFFTVARVYSLDIIDPTYNKQNSPKKKAKHIADNYQKVGIQPAKFYLQELAEIQSKSVVSFIELHSIRNIPENIEYLKTNRILRLNSDALEDFQYRISYFFGRFATPDDYMLTEEEKSLTRKETIQPENHPSAPMVATEAMDDIPSVSVELTNSPLIEQAN